MHVCRSRADGGPQGGGQRLGPAANILFAISPQATPEQKAEAKAKATAALKEIKGGADFAVIAKSQSQDPGSAQNGGDLGFFPKGQMTPAFEEAAF